jgi:hypothetical protein
VTGAYFPAARGLAAAPFPPAEGVAPPVVWVDTTEEVRPGEVPPVLAAAAEPAVAAATTKPTSAALNPRIRNATVSFVGLRG